MQSFGRDAGSCHAEAAPSRARSWWRESECALLIVLVSGIYFSRLTEPSIRGEESRRGRIAWEMIDSGDWIVPRIQGEPLLSRPPLQNWTIALVGLLRGKVDVVAVRLPSAMATLLTAVLLYGYGRTFLSPVGALVAGLAYPTMGHVLELGRLGETEALFTLLLSASLLVWHWSFVAGRSAAWTWSASYFFVALATLAKGPQAPVYFAGAVGAYLLATRQWRFAVSWAHLGGIALFALLLGAWQVPCYLELGWKGVTQLYYSDVALRFGDTRWITFLKHMVTFPAEVLCACLMPWSFLLIAYTNRPFRETIGGARPQIAFLAASIGVAFLSVWLTPEAMPRYFMPLYPCFALLIGLVADRCLAAEPSAKWQKVWPIYWSGLAIVMVVAGAGVLSISLLDPESVAGQPAGFACLYAVLSLVCAAATWRACRRQTPAHGKLALLALSVFLGLSCSGVMVNSQIRKSERAGQAIAQLKQQIPGNAHLVSFGQVHHLFLFHYGQRVDLEAWPTAAAAVDRDLTYFCFDGEKPRTQPIPFPWEVVDVISCDRYRRSIPDQKVVIGRRLTPAEVAARKNVDEGHPPQVTPMTQPGRRPQPNFKTVKNHGKSSAACVPRENKRTKRV